MPRPTPQASALWSPGGQPILESQVSHLNAQQPRGTPGVSWDSLELAEIFKRTISGESPTTDGLKQWLGNGVRL